jgi:hypothetical protein
MALSITKQLTDSVQHLIKEIKQVNLIYCTEARLRTAYFSKDDDQNYMKGQQNPTVTSANTMNSSFTGGILKYMYTSL